MNIEQLRYFLAVVEHGSVISTADYFFMTPQAINASLRKLEAEFDSQFFVRNKKGVTLTPQGHIFAAYAKEVVEKNEKIHLLLRAFNNQDTNLSGTLSIFSASIFTDTVLPTAVRNFTQINPQTNIKIMPVNSGDILPHVLNGFCDLALVTANKTFLEQFVADHSAEQIHMIPLLNDRIVVCAPPTHPLVQQSKLSSHELEEYVQQTNNPISFYHILFPDSDGMQYQKSISSANSAELHKKLMQENNVLTCMPNMAYHAAFQGDGFTAIPLGKDNSTIHALLYRDEPDSKNAELLAQFIRLLQRQFEHRYGVYKEL